MSGGVQEEVASEKKRCTACDLVLSVDMFHGCRARRDGKQNRCKECDKKWAEINRKPKKPEFFEPGFDAGPKKSYSYRGVTGGMLLAGYVRTS